MAIEGYKTESSLLISSKGHSPQRAYIRNRKKDWIPATISFSTLLQGESSVIGTGSPSEFPGHFQEPACAQLNCSFHQSEEHCSQPLQSRGVFLRNLPGFVTDPPRRY